MEIKRGDIYWTDLNPTRGSEIRKKRPCVVVGVDPINRARRSVVVIPLSSSGKAHPPLAIPVNCMGIKAIAIADQIRAVDKSRLLEKCDKINTEDLENLEHGLKVVLGL